MARAQYALRLHQGTVPVRRAPMRRISIPDMVVLLSIMIVTLLADSLRLGGGIGYLGCVLLAALSLGQGISRKTTRDAMILSAIVLVYAGLSFVHVLPRGWTYFYDQSAILRQALPLIGFCVMLVAFHRFWNRVLAGHIPERVLWAILAVLFLAGPIVDLALGVSPTSRMVGTLRNTSLIFLVITSHLAYSRRGRYLLLLPIAYVACAIVTTYSQTRGFYLVSALLLWAYAIKVNVSRSMVIGIVGTTILAATITLLVFTGRDYAQLWYSDYNTAWRLVFWRDTFLSTWMTHGIGVGFGTEALKNVYPEMPKTIFIPNPTENPEFIMIGTHNAFTDILLRCGVVGLATLVWIFLSSARITRRRYSPSVAISFCGAFLCAFVNVGLQSPLYSAGIAFALAYCRTLTAINRGTPRTKSQAMATKTNPVPARQNV